MYLKLKIREFRQSNDCIFTLTKKYKVMIISIIKRFYELEKQSNNHSSEYLEEILDQTTLEDLIETAAMWVRICEGDKYKAAMYILNILDKEDD